MILLSKPAAGGVVWTYKNHTVATGRDGGTTAGIDTTGANLIVIAMCYYQGAVPAPTDNKGNNALYTKVFAATPAGSNTSVNIFYAASPAVGLGHTFTWSLVSGFMTFIVQAWSGAKAAAPLDQQSAGASGAAQPGSITVPAGELLISAQASDGSAATACSGFTISDRQDFGSGSNEGGAMAYFQPSLAQAYNPAWSGNTGGSVCAQCSFSLGP